MFDIGWSEMAIIMLVALVVIGPKDLPRLARTLGQWVAKGRSMAREFQRSLEDMAREAELDDVKREIEKVGRTDVKKSIEKTIDPTGDLGRAFDPNSKPLTASASPPNGEAKEPATKAAEATRDQQAKLAAADSSAKADATNETAAGSKPRATRSKPKAEAKPKTEAKTEAKPRTKAKTSTRSKTAAPKTASSETGKAETLGEPR